MFSNRIRSFQEQFTVDQQPHYVYSPREMTRWVRESSFSPFRIQFFFNSQVRGINEAIRNIQSITGEELVRLWAHEALRLFHDR